MKKGLLRWVLVMVTAVPLFLAGCASHKVNNSFPTNNDATYRAVVTSNPPDANSVARLQAYYAAMQDLVGATDLEGQFIGCIGCARLSSAPPPNELVFIFFREHRVDLYAFITAWERVQASSVASPAFTLRFDTEPPPGAACPKPIPQCYPVNSCVSTSYCDANRSQPYCQKCQ